MPATDNQKEPWHSSMLRINFLMCVHFEKKKKPTEDENGDCAKAGVCRLCVIPMIIYVYIQQGVYIISVYSCTLWKRRVSGEEEG